ncbi:50S ribosomal protein L17 [Patescibacteria group bacterium]|nr:50S ribosomal protein L17 [Patescibacteria group bacterium]MBU1931307.1 50S ribosomal protein L17 [Patescibacteria group bacterium]
MRHRKKGRRLGRNTKQRKALFRSLIGHLIIKGEIKTTQAKAKAIKGLTDRLVSKAKQSTLHVRRQILAFLSNKAAANKLVDVIAPLFKDRVSGFTRIIHLGSRRGDNAEMVKVEFVEKPETIEPIQKSRKKPRPSVGRKPKKPGKISFRDRKTSGSPPVIRSASRTEIKRANKHQSVKRNP